jgi:hypothetical protein
VWLQAAVTTALGRAARALSGQHNERLLVPGLVVQGEASDQSHRTVAGAGTSKVPPADRRDVLSSVGRRIVGSPIWLSGAKKMTQTGVPGRTLRREHNQSSSSRWTAYRNRRHRVRGQPTGASTALLVNTQSRITKDRGQPPAGIPRPPAEPSAARRCHLSLVAYGCDFTQASNHPGECGRGWWLNWSRPTLKSAGTRPAGHAVDSSGIYGEEKTHGKQKDKKKDKKAKAVKISDLRPPPQPQTPSDGGEALLSRLLRAARAKEFSAGATSRLVKPRWSGRRAKICVLFEAATPQERRG